MHQPSVRRPRTLVVCSALAACTALAGCSSRGALPVTDGDGRIALGGMSASRQAADVAASIQSDADILGVLHASNLGEIRAARVARARATDPGVRDFAAMMERDHSRLDERGAEMAQQWGLVPAMPRNQLRDVEESELGVLNAPGVSGSDFDRRYIATQVLDHERTLAIIDAALSRARRPELRSVLQNEVRPPVAQHLQAALALQARIGTP